MSSAKVFVPRTTESLLGVKRALRAALGAPSSHLTEAIAAALGHGTHASLLAEISRQPAAPLVALDDAAFARRLETLSGIHVDATRGPGLFHELEYPPNTGEVRTWSSKFAAIKYKSTKERAWRNMMVAGINAGIEQRLF